MTNEEIAIRITKHGEEIGSLKHRVNDLEEISGTIQELVVSVKELAVNMRSMMKEQEKVSNRIQTLESRPIKKYETLATIIITALASGVIGYLFSLI